MPSWLEVTPNHGDGGNTPVVVSVNVVEDNLAAERSFTFTVDGSYGNVTWETPKTVTQRKYVFEVTGDTGNINLSDNKEVQKTLYIKSSGSWTAISSDDSVVEPVTMSGSASRDYAVSNNMTVKTNYTDQERLATVTVQSEHYKGDSITPALKKVINITQPAYVFKVGGKTANYDYGSVVSADGVSNQQISVNCSGTWTATSSESWLTVTPGTTSLSFNVAANKPTGTADTQVRSAKITVKTTDPSLRTIVITVKQSGAKAQ